MDRKRIAAIALLGAVLLTGCGKKNVIQEPEKPKNSFTYSESFTGTVKERFTENETEYMRISVLGGEEITVSIGRDCDVTGSRRIWTGDYVELECATTTDDDSRSAVKVKVTGKGYVSGAVDTYIYSGNRIFTLKAATGETYGFIISERTALNWNAPTPGGNGEESYVISWDDFGEGLSATVAADKATTAPTGTELEYVAEWYTAKRITVTDIPSGWFDRPSEGA